MKINRRISPNSLRAIMLTAIRFWLVVLVALSWQTITVFSQDSGTPESPEETETVFQVTLADLGYSELVLNSPYGTAEITLRLPEGWEVQRGSFFRLEFSYTHELLNASEGGSLPNLFGDLIVALDDQTLQRIPLQEAVIDRSRVRVPLPTTVFNDPAQVGRSHRLQIVLDANIICDLPHRASLTVHSASFLSLAYNQLPVTVDLALYPRPFQQRSFEPDQVRFVLPENPTEQEMIGATAVAARLGDLTFGMTISGTTDLALLERLEATLALDEHLIIVGRPETNRMIPKLAELEVLPLPLRERQLSFTTEGPAVVTPSSSLTYTLTLVNTTQDMTSTLALVNALPAYANLITCNPSCTEDQERREVSWSVPPLQGGETVRYTLVLSTSGAIAGGVLENTAVLLDAAAEPINVSTLTTIISATLATESEVALRASTAGEGGFFFVQGERAVPEHDGVVQEIVSPWDQRRAILIITGLSDEAVAKASHAMSSQNLFPTLEGSFALVQAIRSPSEIPIETRSTDLTFGELGYDDRLLRGFSQEASYYFDLPLGWQLTKSAYLELYFTHSQLINYQNSFLNVSLNNTPIATLALNEETAQSGYIRMELPVAQTRHGQANRISIETDMQSFDICSNADVWLLISNQSRLYLDHQELDAPQLDLDLYPYPFNERADLSNILLALPTTPLAEEWEKALQLAAALGRAADGPDFAPAVSFGDTRPEAELGDYHIFAIGRPSRNPMLQKVNSQLPQPFLPNSDQIEQKLNEIVLRLPADVSLGYVQLIVSPWNNERSFLAVTGTTQESVKWAIDVLINQSWVLKGDLTLITLDEIRTIDTRRLTGGGVAAAIATAVPEMTPVVASTDTPTPPPDTPTPSPTEPVASNPELVSTTVRRPAWLIPLVGATGLVVIAIFAIAFWQSRRRRA